MQQVNTIEENLIHFKLRITYGLNKPNINDLKLTHSILYEKPYITEYLTCLEKGKEGQWHSQGLLTINETECQTRLGLKKLVYKNASRLESNRKLRDIVKTILNIKGKGNKFISMTPLQQEYDVYASYCCKDGIHIVGTSYEKYHKKWIEKKSSLNKDRRKKYKESKDKRILVLDKYRELSNFQKDLSGSFIPYNDISYNHNNMIQAIIQTYKNSDWTLYQAGIKKHHQDILKLHPTEYESQMSDLILDATSSRMAMKAYNEMFWEANTNTKWKQ